MYDYNAVKELITNALVHNDWSNGYSPKFEIFNNKLVISSNGGIQEGVSQEEFLEGFSNPRNPELMRIFRDLNFVEQLGTGIQRVLKTYDKKIFEFFFRVFHILTFFLFYPKKCKRLNIIFSYNHHLTTFINSFFPSIKDGS